MNQKLHRLWQDLEPIHNGARQRDAVVAGGVVSF